jgi:hypothetical protein
MNFLKRLYAAYLSIKMTVRVEMWPIFYDYIFFYVDKNKKNKYLEYPIDTEMDEKRWPYSFNCSNFDLTLIPIAANKILNGKMVEDDNSYDYICNYKNSHDISILFSKEDFFNEVKEEFEKLKTMRRAVMLTKEIAEKNYDIFYSEIYNPKITKYIRVIPNEDKVEELIKTLIKYYKNSGYDLTEKIFNDTLFTPDLSGSWFLLYADSDAMSAELSFIILSNNLAEILE